MPGSPRANHPILYREDDDQGMPVWVNRLTTIRVNELEGSRLAKSNRRSPQLFAEREHHLLGSVEAR